METFFFFIIVNTLVTFHNYKNYVPILIYQSSI